MRVIFSLLLILGGICGMIIFFLSDITVSSTVDALNGMNLSTIGAGFSIIILINGIYDLFSSAS